MSAGSRNTEAPWDGTGSPEFIVAGSLLLIVTFMAFLSHANIRTPRWLGYITVRPESHSVHHQRGSHRNNYCELPVIDMLFGTFVNPETFVKEYGFYDGASARVIDMHLFKDVSKPELSETAVDDGIPQQASVN